MKSTKTFNNISDKLRASIPKLKPKERVVFQMLNGVPNPEPDDKERSKSPILYPKIQIQTRFTIYDPYQKDESGKEVGGYVEVGCVDVWLRDQPEKFRCFVPGSGEFAQFQGKFELTGGNIRDEELYEILYLSNQRDGNPNRDISVEPLFKIMDVNADSKKSITKYETLRKALDLVKDINSDRAKKILSALNQPVYQDTEILKAKVAELASSNPELFIKIYDDPSIDLKYKIKQAFDSQILTYELHTGSVKMDGVFITKMIISGDESQPDAFYNFITSSENGKSIMDNIEKQLNGKKEVASEKESVKA